MRRVSLALLTGALAVGIIAAPAAAKQPDMSGSNIVDTAIAVNTTDEPVLRPVRHARSRSLSTSISSTRSPRAAS